MKCNRCGKENPAEIHTCTAPLAIALAEKLESQFPEGTAHSFLDGEAAAELRRLHAENEALRKALDNLRMSAYWITLGGEFAAWVNDKKMSLASAKELHELQEMMEAAEAALARAGEVK